MNIMLLQPYIQAARDVIAKETGGAASPGKVALKKAVGEMGEVSVLIGVTGKLEGVVLLMMPQTTALNIVSEMTGETYAELDELAESAIAEMVNVITGRAGTELAGLGHATSVSPPTLLRGTSASISTLAIPIYAIPFETSCGQLELQVALKEVA